MLETSHSAPFDSPDLVYEPRDPGEEEEHEGACQSCCVGLRALHIRNTRTRPDAAPELAQSGLYASKVDLLNEDLYQCINTHYSKTATSLLYTPYDRLSTRHTPRRDLPPSLPHS